MAFLVRLLFLLLWTSCSSQTPFSRSSYFLRVDFHEVVGFEAAISTERVHGEMECIWRCNRAAGECKAVNYEDKASADGLHKCVLWKHRAEDTNNSTLRPTNNFHYFYKVALCPPGWLTYEGSASCYKAVYKNINWNNARDTCKALGGDLVTIKSEQENQFVFELERNVSMNANLWIGLHRDSSEQLKWVDGSALSGQYSKWSTGEPNNLKKKEDCGMMYLTGDRGSYWNDCKCDYLSCKNYVFACEAYKV